MAEHGSIVVPNFSRGCCIHHVRIAWPTLPRDLRNGHLASENANAFDARIHAERLTPAASCRVSIGENRKAKNTIARTPWIEVGCRDHTATGFCADFKRVLYKFSHFFASRNVVVYEMTIARGGFLFSAGSSGFSLQRGGGRGSGIVSGRFGRLPFLPTPSGK